MPDQPFDSELRAPTYDPPPTQLSGWEGKGTSIGNIASQFLAGVSKGRAAAFNRSEAQRHETINSLQQAMKDVSASSASDDVKNQQMQKLTGLFAQLIVHDHNVPKDPLSPDPQGGAKGKGADQQQHPAHHLLEAVRGIAGNFLGPGAQKQKLDPAMIQATVGDVYKNIYSSSNSTSAQAQAVDQKLGQVWDEKFKGKTPTTADIQNDPDVRTLYGQAQALKTPGAQRIAALTAEADKQSDPAIKAKLADTQSSTDLHKSETARANAETAEIKAKTATIGSTPPVKYTADIQTRLQAQKLAQSQDPDERRAGQAEIKRLDTRDRGVQVRIDRELATPPGGKKGGEANQSDANEIAKGIVDGDQPPDLRSLYRMSGPVRAALEKKGYNLVTAQKDWEAVTKHIATMNGNQQERLRQAVTFTNDSIPIIEDLYAKWQKTGLPGGFKDWNKAALLASTKLPGDAGAIANNLMSQINDMTSEMGTVYKGGNSSTDESLKLAASNLSGDWNAKTFKMAIDRLRTNLQIRKNSIQNSQPQGLSANSPYADQPPPNGQQQAAPRNNAAPPASTGTKKTGNKAVDDFLANPL